MHYILDKGEARGEGSLRCQGLSIREQMEVRVKRTGRRLRGPAQEGAQEAMPWEVRALFQGLRAIKVFLELQLSAGGSFAPRDTWQCWKILLVSQLRRDATGISWERPGIQLNTLQSTGQPPTPKNVPPWGANSLELRVPVLRTQCAVL